MTAPPPLHPLVRQRLQLILDHINTEELRDAAIDDNFGLRIRITDHCHIYIQTLGIGEGFRIVEVIPDDSPYEPASGWLRGWDYEGDDTAWIQVLVAAILWDGQADSEPAGWTRALPDGRRDGAPAAGIRQASDPGHPQAIRR